MLDHWDNLDRHVERGYAGLSLWDWQKLPRLPRPALHRLCPRRRLDRDQRHRPQQRQLQCRRPDAALSRAGQRRSPTSSGPTASASISRRGSTRRWRWAASRPPIRSIRGCAPGGGPRPTRSTGTSPISAASWSRPIRKGTPGPQDYRRTHADGANMMADALAPHGGVVIWRAFVYSAEQQRRPLPPGL